jgi:hypothetical protein
MIEIIAYHGHGSDGCADLEPMVMQTCSSRRPHVRLFKSTCAVMATNVGHPDLRLLHEGKSWIPAFAGMTLWAPSDCDRH